MGSAKAGESECSGAPGWAGAGVGCCGGLTSGVRKSHIQLDSLQEIPACTRVLKEKTRALNDPPDSRASVPPEGSSGGTPEPAFLAPA